MKSLSKQLRTLESYLYSILMAVLAAIGMPSAAQQKGKATFYSQRANGSRTASGERIHSDSLVCAHRTHPFGTLLKVRNPANGKEVVVRVIDRGPFSRGRVIDLSYRAARELGIVAQGVAMVEVSVYKRKVEIPFKPDDGFDVPELDLEMTESDDKIVPQWQDEDEKTVAVPAKKTAGKSTGKSAMHPNKATEKVSGKSATSHSKGTGKASGRSAAHTSKSAVHKVQPVEKQKKR
ncbi:MULTISPECIES: septal ring lytic transglycosylase RlpA family protein [unclassified Prevotella]|uniref:septal ring lytic transglycosylase RlpA family protein n=1 Tax=unclassified Prevotella TaxID=2638335 RepID=UPI0020B11EE0|nr:MULTISPECIES: septal ring lytic transglycosylase RlpA family protein [unclassified Prevotella]